MAQHLPAGTLGRRLQDLGAGVSTYAYGDTTAVELKAVSGRRQGEAAASSFTLVERHEAGARALASLGQRGRLLVEAVVDTRVNHASLGVFKATEDATHEMLVRVASTAGDVANPGSRVVLFCPPRAEATDAPQPSRAGGPKLRRRISPARARRVGSAVDPGSDERQREADRRAEDDAIAHALAMGWDVLHVSDPARAGQPIASQEAKVSELLAAVVPPGAAIQYGDGWGFDLVVHDPDGQPFMVEVKNGLAPRGPIVSANELATWEGNVGQYEVWVVERGPSSRATDAVSDFADAVSRCYRHPSAYVPLPRTFALARWGDVELDMPPGTTEHEWVKRSRALISDFITMRDEAPEGTAQ